MSKPNNRAHADAPSRVIVSELESKMSKKLQISQKKRQQKPKKMHLNAKPSTFQNAKKLRYKMTPAEKILWATLENKLLNGLKFRRQHPISRYVLDFYCHKAKLGIELDGKYHEKKSQQLYDLDRTENLEVHDIQIIRFENEEVMNDLPKVLTIIQKECKDRIF